MLNVTLLVLTFNEDIHISRLLSKTKNVFSRIILIDSFSSDQTIEIAKEHGVEIYFNKWPGCQSLQLNWALENIKFDTEWIFRLDADEYLSLSLINEIESKLPKLDNNISAVYIKLSRIFLNKKLSHFSNNIYIIRLFKHKKCIYDNNIMDEKIKLLEGEFTTFKHDFFDHNLRNLDYWVEKHNYYSTREAIQFFLNFQNSDLSTKSSYSKYIYYKLPIFLRPFLFFIYRYFILFGFVDGVSGFLWHFHQCLWYRVLVDSKIFEIKFNNGNDVDKIKIYIKKNYPSYI